MKLKCEDGTVRTFQVKGGWGCEVCGKLVLTLHDRNMPPKTKYIIAKRLAKKHVCKAGDIVDWEQYLSKRDGDWMKQRGYGPCYNPGMAAGRRGSIGGGRR